MGRGEAGEIIAMLRRYSVPMLVFGIGSLEKKRDKNSCFDNVEKKGS